MSGTDAPDLPDLPPSPAPADPGDTVDGNPPVDTEKDKGPSAGALWRETAFIVIAALVIAIVVRTFLVQAFYVPSASMENTLLPDDRIIASKITTTITGVNRGDVVVFTDPGGWLPPSPGRTGPGAVINNALTWIGLLPSDSGEDLVKRVIGVGGDHVVCCSEGGRIVLNGVALNETGYLKPGVSTTQKRFDVIVPADHVFVMGDNRPNSEDSRFHLPDGTWAVPVDDVIGKVVAVVWPLSNFTTVGTPLIFDDPKIGAGAPGAPAEGKVIFPTGPEPLPGNGDGVGDSGSEEVPQP